MTGVQVSGPTADDTSTTSCIRCPAGLYCPSGTAVLPSSGSHACPVAKYCPAGTSAPVNCPGGSYNPSTGRAASSECVACPAGQYCLLGSSAVGPICSAGYYCPLRSSSATQQPCAAGSFRSTTGGTSQTDCDTCPASLERAGYVCVWNLLLGVGAWEWWPGSWWWRR